LAPSTAVDDHQHIFFKRYEDMSRIYEGFRAPRKVLLFDFDSTELEVLLKGQALCNEIDVQFSQRWKDYE